MKKICFVLAAAWLLLLCGCQIHGNPDASDGAHVAEKKQEIAVVSADTSEVLEKLTGQEEVDQFVQALDLETWTVSTLPDDAVEIGSFVLTQEKTILFGRDGADDTRCIAGQLTFYQGGYIHYKSSGLDMVFAVSPETAAYLNGYFA